MGWIAWCEGKVGSSVNSKHGPIPNEQLNNRQLRSVTDNPRSALQQISQIAPPLAIPHTNRTILNGQGKCGKSTNRTRKHPRKIITKSGEFELLRPNPATQIHRRATTGIHRHAHTRRVSEPSQTETPHRRTNGLAGRKTYRRGRVAVVADHDELVAVVRPRHHPPVGRHLRPHTPHRRRLDRERESGGRETPSCL